MKLSCVKPRFAERVAADVMRKLFCDLGRMATFEQVMGTGKGNAGHFVCERKFSKGNYFRKVSQRNGHPNTQDCDK